MAAQKQQWILMDECINDYIDEAELSIHKYSKLWHIAHRGLTEMGLDFFYTIRSVKLPVNANLTVNLPDDYLQYCKIGILNSMGEIIPMSYNNKLTKYADLNPNRIQKTQDNTVGDLLLFDNSFFGNCWCNFWNGDSYTVLYGCPSGGPFVGTFKIDNENGIILLGEGFAFEYLMVEYVASPKEGGVYYLPIQFKEALISYLRWKDIISLPNTRRGSLGDKAQRRHEYFNDRRLANARYRPIYLEEALEWSMESTRLAVKM
jgi:hypothetical protein